MIKPLAQEEVALRWAEIKPYVDRALEHSINEHTAHDWFLDIMHGHVECWEAIVDGKTTSFGLVRVNHFPQHKQLQIITAAGDGWDDYGPEALEYAEDVARHIGCARVTVWGRPGWQKKMKALGYEHAYTVMSKEV